MWLCAVPEESKTGQFYFDRKVPPEQLAHACVSLAAPPVRGAEQAASAAATAHLRDLHGRAKDGAHFASIRKKHVLCEQRQLACPYNDF